MEFKNDSLNDSLNESLNDSLNDSLHSNILICSENEDLKNEFISENSKYSLWKNPKFKLLILDILTESFLNKDFNDNKNDNTNNNKKIIATLQIIQNIALDKNVKSEFLASKYEHVIFPFLQENVDECIKIEALGVFFSVYSTSHNSNNHLHNSNNHLHNNIISIHNYSHLLSDSEILPFTLQVMGSDSQAVKLRSCQLLYQLLQGSGLDYAVQTVDRFLAIEVVLSPMFSLGISSKNIDLISILIKIFLRLCEQPNAKSKIVSKPPEGVLSVELRKIIDGNVNSKDDFELLMNLILPNKI